MRTQLAGTVVWGSGLARAALALGLALALGVHAQVVGLGGGPGKKANPKLTCGLEVIPAQLAPAKAAKGTAMAGAATLDAVAASLLPIHGDCVAIDAVASGDAKALLADLQALGLRHGAVSGRLVGGLLPLAKVGQLANLKSLKLARPAYRATHAGLVTSQGDKAQRSDLARSAYGVDGTGTLVGVLSDSFDDLGGAWDDILSDDLPWNTYLLDNGPGGGTDEGRAMMQIVHDVAPGADVAFHTAWWSQADFAQGIRELADFGCNVIVDDVIYFAEAMFQDDNVAQAADYAKAMGVAYFSAAGNQADDSYEAPYRESGSWTADFDPGPGVDDLLDITLGKGDTAVVLQWDDPFYSISGAPGAATDLDIELYQAGVPLGIGSWGANLGGDPVEIFGVTNPGGPVNLQIRISRFGGPIPGRLKLVWFGTMALNEYATNSSTIYGHANAAGAEAVGAARYTKTPPFGQTPPLLEYFSSVGVTSILFDTAGNRLAVPEIRVKPGIVAPDGGNTTFFWPGDDYEPDGWPNFFGTSAAAPHAAGVAALMLDANGSLSPALTFSLIRSTALDMDVAGFDNNTGYGLVQADWAVYLAGLPDLVVPVLGHASPTLVARYLSAGQVYVRCQQANRGGSASRSCVVRFWLSTDAVLSKGTDKMLAVGAVRSLNPGQATAVTTTLLRLGRLLAPGETVYIIAEVDADGAVPEMLEGNNTAVLKVTGI